MKYSFYIIFFDHIIHIVINLNQKKEITQNIFVCRNRRK